MTVGVDDWVLYDGRRCQVVYVWNYAAGDGVVSLAIYEQFGLIIEGAGPIKRGGRTGWHPCDDAREAALRVGGWDAVVAMEER